MSAFAPKGPVTATFLGEDLGTIGHLDIGVFDAPDEAEFQCYVFTLSARRDRVRFTRATQIDHPAGRLGELCLADLYGARYRTEACFLGCTPHASGAWEHTFESQGQSEIRAPAAERHGVGSVAAALLLDALDDEDDG